MAPKRKQPAQSATKPASKRRSKLAKEHGISPEAEAEIQEIWSMFRREEDGYDEKHGVITAGDAKRCLVALNAPPKNNDAWLELLEIMDPEESGFIEYEQFYAVAALQMNQRAEDPEALHAEVQKAYQLFTKHQDREININDLKRIATELKEDVPDSVLRDMIREATGGELDTVSIDHFEDVMKRAGVFG
ncbi:hypothetical protein AMS68_000816 [Peltaster fructicola]|uniref:Calmodulin n=1 Tax=Peltaster fructicola TaxID=286661 RepID=A0A6H0XKZ9_9PEZI|nr:hypothetical protein AMS68_000816 [Peltaster fructicola]